MTLILLRTPVRGTPCALTTITKLPGNERFRPDCEAVLILAEKIEKHKSLSNLDLG